MTRLLVSARPGPYLSRCTAAGSRHRPAATFAWTAQKDRAPQRFPLRELHPIKHHVADPGTNPRVADRSKAGRPRAHDPLSHQLPTV